MGIRHAHLNLLSVYCSVLVPLPRGKDISLPKRVKFLSLEYGRAQYET